MGTRIGNVISGTGKESPKQTQVLVGTYCDGGGSPAQWEKTGEVK